MDLHPLIRKILYLTIHPVFSCFSTPFIVRLVVIFHKDVKICTHPAGWLPALFHLNLSPFGGLVFAPVFIELAYT